MIKKGFTYPELEALVSTIKDMRLKLELEPITPEFESISFRRITFRISRLTFSIPVEDEYNDVIYPSQPMFLQLVLMSLEYYEECEDILEWSKGYGLNVSESRILSIYRELGEIAPKIRDLLGFKIKSISSFDWQLNARAAQALRELEL